jgi:hypothetical protein
MITVHTAPDFSTSQDKSTTKRLLFAGGRRIGILDFPHPAPGPAKHATAASKRAALPQAEL